MSSKAENYETHYIALEYFNKKIQFLIEEAVGSHGQSLGSAFSLDRFLTLIQKSTNEGLTLSYLSRKKKCEKH